MGTPLNPHATARQRHPIRNGLLILAALLVVALLIFYAIGRRNLTMAVGRARALGPTTFAELEAARRSWPADQDAGPAFARIAQAMSEQEKGMTSEERKALKAVPYFGQRELPPPGQLWNQQDQASVSEHLRRMDGFMRDLDALRAYPGGKLKLEVGANPLEMLLPELAPIRGGVKLESLAILRTAMDGPVQDLTERVEVMTRLHQLIEDQPTLISALVAVACDSLLCDTLERTLALDAVSREDLQPLSDSLADRRPHESIKWGLLGERATFIQTGQQLLSGKLSGLGGVPFAGIPVLNAVFYLDIAYGVGHHNRIITAVADPKKLLEATRTVEQKMKTAPSWALFTKILMPSVTRAVEMSMQSEAQLRAARIGLSIERYRLEKGAFPGQLTELVPAYLRELPPDPFDGQPMRYRRTDEGVVVYSVGVDRKDDAGLAPVKQRRDQSDVVFRVLAPEHRRRAAAAVAASEPGEE
jgi:hypothetical protein